MKPLLVFWLIALASWSTHAVTVRATIRPSLLAAIGLVLQTYCLGRRLFDADTGAVAGRGAIAICIGCDKAGPSAGMPQAG